MSEIFFISDSHFSHKGIIEFSGTKPHRPFASIEEHDAELVRRWNNTVGPKDIVWHLGDFCFGKRNIAIAAQLNGDKRLVLGNHDLYGKEEYLRYFTKVEGAYQYQGMILTHIPVHPCNFPRYFMNVHGHLHERLVMNGDVPDHRYKNVSCEQISLTPIPLDEILNQWGRNN